MTRRRASVEPSGFTILLVDDQEETLISGRLLLEREGHRVLTASSGIEALAIFRANPVDLVIVDYFMPQMTGEELVRAIRRLEEDVQIVLQTGYSGEKPPREMMRRLDIQGYHDKAEGPDRLLLWVAVALKASAQIGKIKQTEREIENSRGQLRRLSARLLTVQDEERERISRELHDQLGQILTAICLDLEWSIRHCPEQRAEERARLDEAAELARRAIQETRELCASLRPVEISGAMLVDELRRCAEEFGRRGGFAVRFISHWAPIGPSPEVARNIFRVVQESMNNVVRHAHASEVSVELARQDGKFAVTISDNGRGFDVAKASAHPYALGLVGMRERANLIGASLAVVSTPGSGSSVRLEISASAMNQNQPPVEAKT